MLVEAKQNERGYEISRILDEHPELVDRAHVDLRKPLAKAKRRGPQGRACRFSSDTVLRMCLVKVLEGVPYRRIIVRVDDSWRLRTFTRIHNGPMIDYSTLYILPTPSGPRPGRRSTISWPMLL